MAVLVALDVSTAICCCFLRRLSIYDDTSHGTVYGWIETAHPGADNTDWLLDGPEQHSCSNDKIFALSPPLPPLFLSAHPNSKASLWTYGISYLTTLSTLIYSLSLFLLLSSVCVFPGRERCWNTGSIYTSRWSWWTDSQTHVRMYGCGLMEAHPNFLLFEILPSLEK